MDLLHGRVAGPQRVGQPPHRVGNHQNQPRRRQRSAQERNLNRVKHPQIANGQHHPRNGQWQRRHHIQQALAHNLPPDQQKRNQRPQHHVDARRQQTVQQRIHHKMGRLHKNLSVVRQRVGLGQQRKAPEFGKRQQHDPNVRNQTHPQHRNAKPQHPRQLPPPDLPHHARPGRPPLRRRVLRKTQVLHRNPQRRQGQQHHNHRNHIPRLVLEPDIGHPQICLRRQHIRIIQHQRRAQIVHRLDKHQQRPGHVTRQHQRQRHLPKQPPPVRAQVLRHLLQRRVHIGQGRRGIEQNERKIVKRLHNHHPGQPLHKRHRRPEPAQQQQVHRAAAPQHQLHRNGAHERRHHQRQNPQRLDDPLAPKIEPHRKKRQRQGNRTPKNHRQHPGQQAVPERLPEQIPLEKIQKMHQRRAVVLRKRHVHHLQNGVQDKHEQQPHQQQIHDKLVCVKLRYTKPGF